MLSSIISMNPFTLLVGKGIEESHPAHVAASRGLAGLEWGNNHILSFLSMKGEACPLVWSYAQQHLEESM